MENFFLSYARADQGFALRLAMDLRGAGYAVWVDQLNISPSQLWDRAVEAAVRECTGLILILSPRAVVSENVLDELGTAIESRKRIIPVLYEKCEIPMRLARIQFIDATIGYDLALGRCKAALGTQVGSADLAVGVGAGAAIPGASGVEWQPHIIEKAQKILTQHVGPVASILVQMAAAHASTETELYSHLAAAIPNERERARFLSRSSLALDAGAAPAEPDAEARPSSGFEAAYVEAVVKIVTVYFGPLSRHVVDQDHLAATDREDLYRRLSARIPHEGERAELLRKLRAL